MIEKLTWTEGRRKAFITSLLRSGFRKYPAKFEALKAAFTSKKLNKKSGKQANHYRCNKCKKEFTSTNIQVDHINPVVDVKEGFISWDKFIERLFCDSSNLQVLCLSCHAKKTANEKRKRNSKVNL